MKLMPDTALIHSPIAGTEGGKAAKPRPGAQTSGAADFFSQLRGRSDPGREAIRSPGEAPQPAKGGTPRLASSAAEARASSEAALAVGVEWPWLAIATGGLSFRPTSSAAAFSEAYPVSAALAERSAAMPAGTSVARPAPEAVGAAASQPASLMTMSSLVSMDVGSPTTASPEALEVDTTTWPLPAELRELLERRRLRLVEDGSGGLHLFARDFAMDEAQADRWAAALREACQSMKQPLRALWINGRAYEVQQGERHDG
jgi:hypothetical protein